MAKAKSTKATPAKPADEDKLLTGLEVLDTEDLVTDSVYVKDWGGRVGIRLMDASSAENWGRQASEKDATSVSSALALVRACAVNPDGSAMFPSKAQIEALAKKSMRAIRTVSDACIKLNGLGDGRRRELAEMLRTRAEDEKLDTGVVAVLMELAEELDGRTAEDLAKNV